MNFGAREILERPRHPGLKASVPLRRNPFVIVTELALPDHWHVYYKNPGTVGLPMEAAFQPVPGFRVEGPFWQIPELGKGLVDFYGYSGKAKMAFRVTPEKDAPPEATFTTTMTWQMCAEQCAAPETKDFSVTKRGDGRAPPTRPNCPAAWQGLPPPTGRKG
ncbi:MAG: protein-disulfide reductase DsbD domain-containing protein [Akkermansia sp.]